MTTTPLATDISIRALQPEGEPVQFSYVNDVSLAMSLLNRSLLTWQWPSSEVGGLISELMKSPGRVYPDAGIDIQRLRSPRIRDLVSATHADRSHNVN